MNLFEIPALIEELRSKMSLIIAKLEELDRKVSQLSS